MAIDTIMAKQAEIAELCQQPQVARLDSSGHATQSTLDPITSVTLTFW